MYNKEGKEYFRAILDQWETNRTRKGDGYVPFGKMVIFVNSKNDANTFLKTLRDLIADKSSTMKCEVAYTDLGRNKTGKNIQEQSEEEKQSLSEDTRRPRGGHLYDARMVIHAKKSGEVVVRVFYPFLADSKRKIDVYIDV